MNLLEGFRYLTCRIFGHRTRAMANPYYYRRMPAGHPALKLKNCCLRCNRVVDLRRRSLFERILGR